MKTLLISRHAKADYTALGGTDFDRKILQKGVERTKKVCLGIKNIGILPQYIISSGAVRTKQTAGVISEQFKISDDNILFNKKLYLGNIEDWLEEIDFIDNKLETLILVGHNPTVTYLVNYFLPEEKIFELPTSGVVCLKFNCDKWEDISPENSKIISRILE